VRGRRQKNDIHSTVDKLAEGIEPDESPVAGDVDLLENLRILLQFAQASFEMVFEGVG
jgi:hypothetical protein